MDIDRFVAAHGAEWERLADLSSRAGRSGRRLSGAELDELISLYSKVSTHLSEADATGRGPELTVRLSRLVNQAGTVVHGARQPARASARRFVSVTFPAALWRVRAFLVVSAVLTFVPALAVGTWLARSPAAVQASGPAAARSAYVHQDFEAYYSSAPAAEFATEVYTNNLRVAVAAFAAGILLCLPTVILLVVNGASLGLAAGLFAASGELPRFFGLILPHGLIELTSVVIAGAAGLRLGWTVIDPGDRPRTEALAAEGRAAVVLVFGVAVTLAVAGVIEGFVTGSGLPTAIRVAVGLGVEAVFLAYAGVLGRRVTTGP